MHNWIFDLLDIDAQYRSIKINENEILNIINEIKNGDIDE